MSIGRSKEEQELTARLSAGLVQKEVVDPMNKIGWGHGTPPAPDYTTPTGGQPAPAEGAPGQPEKPVVEPVSGQPVKPDSTPVTTEKPKADDTTLTVESLTALYESLRDPTTGLIGGKYKTVSEAIKGSGHLAIMAKQAFQERDQLKANASAPIATPAITTAPVVTPQPVISAPSRVVTEARAKLDKVLSDVAENGGVFDEATTQAFSDAQFKLAEAIADHRMKQQKDAETEDKNAWDEVDKHMLAHYPDSGKFWEEAALYMQSNPAVQKGVTALRNAGDRLGATELMWTAYAAARDKHVATIDESRAKETEADLAAREQVRKEQLEKARADAGIVSGSAGGAGAHENRNTGASREELDSLRDKMRREGDAPGSPAAAEFRRKVIGDLSALFGS